MDDDFRVLCKILKCPNCNNKHLVLIKNYYFCGVCQSKFRIKNGIIKILPKKLTYASKFEMKNFNSYAKVIMEEQIFCNSNLLSFKENIIPLIRGKKPKILEIGCGSMAISRYYKNINSNCEIFVCDLSEKLLQTSNNYNDYGKLDYRFISDILNLPFKDNEFDYVIGTSVLHHIPALEGAMKEIFRVLKPRGYYFGLHEPFGCKLFGRVRPILISWLRNEPFELVLPYDYYYDILKNKTRYLNLKIVRHIKYQRYSHRIMIFYYIFSKILPFSILKQLGGNLMIIAQK